MPGESVLTRSTWVGLNQHKPCELLVSDLGPLGHLSAQTLAILADVPSGHKSKHAAHCLSRITFRYVRTYSCSLYVLSKRLLLDAVYANPILQFALSEIYLYVVAPSSRFASQSRGIPPKARPQGTKIKMRHPLPCRACCDRVLWRAKRGA